MPNGTSVLIFKYSASCLVILMSMGRLGNANISRVNIEISQVNLQKVTCKKSPLLTLYLGFRAGTVQVLRITSILQKRKVTQQK